MICNLGAYLSVQYWGRKKKISGECVHLLNYFHPTAHAMWKRALSACLFAYDAVVRAPVRRDGAWAVFGLKRIKVSVKHSVKAGLWSHTHPSFQSSQSQIERGKKNYSDTNSVFFPLGARDLTPNLCSEKVPPPHVCKEKQPVLNRGDFI